MKKKGDEKDEKNKITKENQSSKQRIPVDWFLHETQHCAEMGWARFNL